MRSVEEHRAVVAELLPRTPATDVPLAAGQRTGVGLRPDRRASTCRRSELGDGRLHRHAPPTSRPSGHAARVARTSRPAPRMSVRWSPGTVAADHDRRAASGRRRGDHPGGADRRRDRHTVRIERRHPPGSTSGLGARTSRPAPGCCRGHRTRTAPPRASPRRSGVRTLPVHRPVEVLLLSTGSELVAPGTPLLPGQIYESNAVMLAAALSRIGAAPGRSTSSPTTSRHFRATLDSSLGGIDLIVTSGGVSAGAYEVVKDALTGDGDGVRQGRHAAGDAARGGPGRRRADRHPARKPGQLVRLVRGVPAARDPGGHGTRRPAPAGARASR